MSEQKYQFSQPLRIQLDVKVPMTDGVNLSTDIYLPPDGGPFPTLLVRTIYDNQADWCIDMAKRAVPQGYAVVMQDCRGRFDSDGEFSPYFQEPEEATTPRNGSAPRSGVTGTSACSAARTSATPSR